MSLLQWLEHVDKIGFSFIHARLANPFLDKVMLAMREPATWIPVYILIIIWALSYDRVLAVKFILLSIITIAFTDFTVSSILKPLFDRSRPCFDTSLQPIIRGIINCGGRLSFPSSHAGNHFGLAAFWYWSILLISGKRCYWLWAWAFIICFAQIYVGKHYPFDIVAGAIYGIAAGSITAKIFENWVNAKGSKKQSSFRLGNTAS